MSSPNVIAHWNSVELKAFALLIIEMMKALYVTDVEDNRLGVSKLQVEIKIQT